MSNSKRAVVLLSGGLDSATVLAIAKSEGYECYALSFDYGQRHQFELQAAEKLCQKFDVQKHVTIEIDLRKFGGSALTEEIEVPKDRDEEVMATGIPITYVPARNTVFLSIALGWAEVLGAFDLFIGVNAVDYSGYPDCRPEFIQQFTKLANLATKAGVDGSGEFNIHTPLIDLTKAQIIQRGITLGVDYSQTHSCYDPNEAGISCGHCDACQLRQRGFENAGLTDPIEYQT
ncbi:7-cyano-7-deazaguanine synthase QueC [Thalassoglobus polymorphus]|uniref:7-cyano-7-deazaguanine synthase n=1 Tax=Thalassoglobus polymorphus TaxID=2527994 RepID=A0A517QPW8_9PLAN|nr:7-cyano-7-deazaguanine synthase QueC [Thalassoglobus polymorphus]QDT33671.1 7-cyano-7-deazaguanine synthase [Thalassoglobus polymorphus]